MQHQPPLATSTADRIAALPEEIIHEVLSRVGSIRDLFNFAATCRWWLRRFTDPAFLRRLLCPARQQGGDDDADGHRPRTRLLGFFFQQTKFVLSQDDDTTTTTRARTAQQNASASAPAATFLPAPGSPLVLHVLAVAPRYISRYSRQHTKVCLHSCSAATRSWSAPSACMDGARYCMVSNGSGGVVHRGAAAARWLCMDAHRPGGDETGIINLCMLVVEVSTGRASMADVPGILAGSSPMLCVSGDGGKLSIVCVHFAHVTVWAKEDDGDDDTAWRRTAGFRKPPVGMQQPVEKWFTPNRGSMLVMFRRSSGGVFILDLDKKVMEKVMDCFLPMLDGNPNRAPVPYEVDLVEFFVLQLGSLCKGLEN